MKTKITVLGLLLFNLSFAQDGVSSGSLSMIQNNGLNSLNERGMFNERMVIIEDFINYHRHDIAIPTQKEVALSIDYSNILSDKNDSFVLQVGLATTTKENLPTSTKNINISLVIDKSSSMRSQQKMEKVKTAMKTFVSELENGTYLSIVSFNGSAGVDMPAVKIGSNRDAIYRIIENINPSGMTNINDGMLSGYEQLMKNHDTNTNSRLILLTDGMTNRGETNVEKIISNSKKYNNKGIEISTIGVGQSLDFDLLRSLAEAGRGSNHFVGENEADIQKVFIDELESLLYQIGKKPEIAIELPQGYTITKFYGYDPSYIAENKVTVSAENLNSGITQIFLMEVSKDDTAANSLINASITYLKNGKQQKITKEVTYYSKTASTNSEIRKNYTIGVMADALREYARRYVINQASDTTLLSNATAFAERIGNVKDQDVKRVYAILKGIETPKGNNTVTVHTPY